MSRILIVGSAAAALRVPGWRQPADVDLFTDRPFERNRGLDPYWHDALAEWLPDGTSRFATLDELLTIKTSHCYWELRNGSWLKHIEDTVRLRAAGAKVDDDLHKLLYRCWEDDHGRKVLDLDQEAKDFFADAVTRHFDHDSLHRSVAYTRGEPLYELFLRPGSEVDMDMAQVWASPVETQLNLFREEVYATALERKVIPSGYRCSPRAAYAWALRRTITSLTKGRSARFLVEHYDELRAPDHDYVAWHRTNTDLLEAAA